MTVFFQKTSHPFHAYSFPQFPVIRQLGVHIASKHKCLFTHFLKSASMEGQYLHHRLLLTLSENWWLSYTFDHFLLRVLMGTLNFLAAARNDRFPSRDFRARSTLYLWYAFAVFLLYTRVIPEKNSYVLLLVCTQTVVISKVQIRLFFLPNSQTQTLVMRKTIAKNQAKNFTILESRPLKSSKKNHF